ncbi:histidine phosphatase family protein [Paraglaciecola polaris]|uniref:Phosphoglycerate mutase n=1 Tax=Paraglaciecola polaris LMG 21857 TaxID=1129793 RepID=K7A7B1_9ALTE|nr:histidine phosphatase family protein [Paraglaciecola polaris]GAC31315.1 phosphoglycerate mutase [Paraglaciecola polaris LMG 21857]|tara:strand:+ start:5198 stop:5830 length:633 start_codon:yes stop_codon:yes gene_type:complete
MDLAKTTIFNLLRHGQVNGPAALYGKTDIPLSEQGWRSMRAQIKQTSRPDIIITSPRLRCVEFAKQMATELDIPLRIEDPLQECHFGRYDGVPFDDLTDQWLALSTFWDDPFHCTLPEAETLDAFHRRVAHCWQRLGTELQGQNCLLICHGGVIRQILAEVLSADWQQGDWYSKLQVGYASLTRITVAEYANAAPVVNFIAKPPFNESAL